jgi:hypothetical protein
MKKYFSLHLLSLLGYLCLFVTVVFLVFTMINTYTLNLKEHDGGFAFFNLSSLLLVKFYILHFIISALTLFLAIVEFCLNKRGKFIKIPNFLVKIKPFILLLGIALVLTPFYLLGLIYFSAKAISIFQGY